MAVNIRKIEHQPILILTYTDLLDTKTFVKAFQTTSEIIRQHRLPAVYRISDMKEATYPGMGELLAVFRYIQNKPEGSCADPRIHGTFIGMKGALTAYARFARMMRVNRKTLPSFQEVEPALAYIRTDPCGIFLPSSQALR